MPSSRSQPLSLWANRHRKWIFAGPAFVFVAAMIVIPIIYTTYLSLTDAESSLRADLSFVGLDNYITVLSDTRRFWPAVGRTLAYTIGAVGVEVTLGMSIALLLRREFRGQSIVRVIIMLPLVATPIAVAMLWRLIFEPTIGLANQALNAVGLPSAGWFSDPSMALPSFMLVDVWQWTPMMVLILLAGLSSLPEEPDEAARVDGASAVQRFRFVTLPLLMPTLLAALLLRSIEAFKTFDILYAVKGPGGGSVHEAETINIFAYGTIFTYNQYGVGSAALLIFFVLVLVLVSIQLLWRRNV